MVYGTLLDLYFPRASVGLFYKRNSASFSAWSHVESAYTNLRVSQADFSSVLKRSADNLIGNMFGLHYLSRVFSFKYFCLLKRMAEAGHFSIYLYSKLTRTLTDGPNNIQNSLKISRRKKLSEIDFAILPAFLFILQQNLQCLKKRIFFVCHTRPVGKNLILY